MSVFWKVHLPTAEGAPERTFSKKKEIETLDEPSRSKIGLSPELGTIIGYEEPQDTISAASAA